MDQITPDQTTPVPANPAADDHAAAPDTLPVADASPADATVRPRNRERGGYVASALAGALAVLVLGGGALWLGSSSGTPGRSSAPSGSGAQAVTSATPSGTGSSGSATPGAAAGQAVGAGQSLGRAEAPVTVEIWADFQCPYCALFAHAIEPTIEREAVAGGEARVVFRDFAFLGAESTRAAIAARCAGQQGAFWRFHDVLYASQNGENQGAFSDALMSQIATYLQLDTAAFDRCIADPAEASALTASNGEAKRLGIQGTPTLRIIGPKETVTITQMAAIPDLLYTIDRLAHGLPPSPAPSAPAVSPAPSTPSATPAASR